ncbi:alpha/beta hydrolase [Phytoactinopolyspora alkaliphila]|nr:alpha/beta hydrolase [Phytoactinopolyspora alkaliphila]
MLAERVTAVTGPRMRIGTDGRRPGYRRGPVQAVRDSLRSLSRAGMAGGIATYCLSLLPSLIPRGWLAQAVFSGITMALGYAIGLLIRWFVRRSGFHPRWSVPLERAAQPVLLAAAAGSLAFSGLAAHWQDRIRGLLGMPGVEALYAAVPVVAAVVALAIVAVAHGVRVLGAAAMVRIRRTIPRVLVRLGTTVALIAFAILVFNGTFMTWVAYGLDRAAAAVEAGRAPEIEQPASPMRSGSAESLVSWDSLSATGQAFVAGGLPRDALAEFAGLEDHDDGPVDPIRVYVPSDPAGDLERAAALVVDELDRTQAWSRDVLVVATPAGNGLVQPAAIATIEMMYAGNTATAALQYSHASSWLSFLSDRNTAPEAGKALFEAVYAAWQERPQALRPKLLVYGESLGSYGGHGAFSGLQDMVARTDGALWVATPNFTETWRDLTDHRDLGSREISPVYDDGIQVRWGTGDGHARDLWDPGPAWEEPRIVYVQHGSDGVVWWSSDLLWHEPDWLREPSGDDVLPGLRWLPVVTYWLTTMDMVVAEEVPAGHGHVYLGEYVDAWAAIAPPTGWTDDDADTLRDLLIDEYAEF